MEMPYRAHLLKRLILDNYKAYRGEIPKSLTDKLILALRFIANNIEGIYLTSIENTNNVVSNIPTRDKAEIKRISQMIVNDYDYQPNSILKYLKGSGQMS